MIAKRLRFADLRALGIVRNWFTLRAWINDDDIKFPPGQLIGPATRVWSEAEVAAWLADRPVATREVPKSPGRPRKAAAEALPPPVAEPPPKRGRGRPRKAAAASVAASSAA